MHLCNEVAGVEHCAIAQLFTEFMMYCGYIPCLQLPLHARSGLAYSYLSGPDESVEVEPLYNGARRYVCFWGCEVCTGLRTGSAIAMTDNVTLADWTIS